MSPEEWRVALAVAVVVVVALWVGLFVDARRRAARSVLPPRPAEAPATDPDVDRAFTLAHVAAVGLVLEQPPTDQLYRDFALAADEAAARRRRMLASLPPA